MAGIDNITAEILKDAEREAAKIIEDANAAAERSRKAAMDDAEKLKQSKNDDLKKKLQIEDKKTQSQCEQAQKLIMLEAKQSIIEDMLVKAKTKMLELSDNEYFDNLLVLLGKQVLADKGILLLNEKDLARVPAGFATSVSDVAEKKGGSLEVSKDTVNIVGGFILKYGNIEINSSLDALFDENRDELIDTVNKMLW